MITYDYTTGKTTRDFKVVSTQDGCKLSGLPCNVGSERCQKCKYYSIMYCSLQHGSFVFCKHPEQKDTDNCWEVLDGFYSKFKIEALSQL